jgi:hypothetical protein
MYNLGSFIVSDNESSKVEIKIQKFIVDAEGKLVILYDVLTHDKIANRINPVTLDFAVTDSSYRVNVVDAQGNPVPVEEGSQVQKTIGNFDFLYRVLFLPYLKNALQQAMVCHYKNEVNPLTYVETAS